MISVGANVVRHLTSVHVILNVEVKKESALQLRYLKYHKGIQNSCFFFPLWLWTSTV